jgi:hypothetical protein
MRCKKEDGSKFSKNRIQAKGINLPPAADETSAPMHAAAWEKDTEPIPSIS